MKMLMLLALLPTFAFSATMKLEGSCQGTFKNGEPVSFNYYSNFNGCRNTATGGIAFLAGGDERLKTGKRKLTDSKDTYTFSGITLIFKNSTGNTGAKLKMKGETLEVSCNVRDYEYADC